jgi:uncharacterized membrane protein YvlD (DUF360 family)
VALAAAAVIAALNAVLSPLVAALRLPFTALLGFFAVLFADAGMLLLADRVATGLSIDSFLSALIVALAASAVGVVLSILFGTNDDDVYSLRVVQRIARRSGERVVTDKPGIVLPRDRRLALPVLQRRMRDGHAPTMARWLADGTHRLLEWEPDLSSQTGASQAGILLGSNDDIPAFRWVEKERKALVALLVAGGLRGARAAAHNGSGVARRWGRQPRQPLLRRSGSRHPHRQPHGGRALGQPRLPRVPRQRFNVTRCLVLFGWEVILEWVAAARERRRDVRPRGHRGGVYPFLAQRCVSSPAT